jgi:hypothetical protein
MNRIAKWYAMLARRALKAIDERIENNQIGINMALGLTDPEKIAATKHLVDLGMGNINTLREKRRVYETFISDLVSGKVTSTPRFWVDVPGKGRKYSRFPITR